MKRKLDSEHNESSQVIVELNKSLTNKRRALFGALIRRLKTLHGNILIADLQRARQLCASLGESLADMLLKIISDFTYGGTQRCLNSQLYLTYFDIRFNYEESWHLITLLRDLHAQSDQALNALLEIKRQCDYHQEHEFLEYLCEFDESQKLLPLIENYWQHPLVPGDVQPRVRLIEIVSRIAKLRNFDYLNADMMSHVAIQALARIVLSVRVPKDLLSQLSFNDICFLHRTTLDGHSLLSRLFDYDDENFCIFNAELFASLRGEGRDDIENDQLFKVRFAELLMLTPDMIERKCAFAKNHAEIADALRFL
ncbi:MAG: hypothetical protein M3R00_03380 [Pseudomonadota bacterium]|nr:hypothetical protein [Pseudomonadota bacterium]